MEKGRFIFIVESIWGEGAQILSIPHPLTHSVKWPARLLRTGLDTSDLCVIIWQREPEAQRGEGTCPVWQGGLEAR